ncbi:hypothetical protein JG688_00002260 [Phytophthora aleatoria]|uniref:Uncharacterized protein n=1 Tax=Phytophthora aleatoria TaxID=2496075 RepID=A0A8J5M8W7_9STRA|nr:hypothetical protein JG688_00002260 [Phytophthora aleatoria]
MANRKITRCRGARGQLALYNPHTVPIEDVMISQRKGEFPPVAFMLIHKDAPGLLKAENAFENAFAIAVLPIPRFTELQLLAISNTMQIKIFTAFSLSSGAKLMMNDELLTRKHAMDTLQTNFPFLTVDECDMLLDLFGA